MKNFFKYRWPWLLTAVFALEVLLSLRPRADKADDFHYYAVGKLPVLLGGRVLPLDSVARNNLLLIRGNTSVSLEGNAQDGTWGRWEDIASAGGLTERKWYQFSKRPKKLKPVPWLVELLAKSEVADTRYIFRIHHPELLGELNLTEKGVDKSGLRYYSFNQLAPYLAQIEREARVYGPMDSTVRSPYQKSLMSLHQSLQLYIRLKNSLRPEMTVDNEALSFSLPNRELAAKVGLPDKLMFSYNEIKPRLESLSTNHNEARRAISESMSNPKLTQEFRTGLTNDLISFNTFFGRIQAYEGLQSIWRPEWKDDYQAELRDFEAVLKPGFAAVQNQRAGQEYDRDVFSKVLTFAERYVHMANLAHPMLIPPENAAENPDDWSNIGKALMDSLRAGSIAAPVYSFVAISAAYSKGDKEAFNRHVAEYRQSLNGKLDTALKKSEQEFRFNQFMPFKRSMIIYIFALLLALASWLNMSKSLMRAGFQLVLLGWVVHTIGLIWRMILEGRPPVTNLYSSAIFVGWGAALLGIILERVFRNGIGTVTASTIGFITLIIAHHLSMAGDTMEMMRAVLDTNFWLSTHVTIITLGYASTFLAGFLAIVYLLRGILTPSLDDETAKSLTRMVYGIVCFATLFSFVGTILGGIWADQSWGRFWGWDPKENGALLIVIWNATILHLRWGGMIRERGLMNCAVFGNIVTAFSWFGVNMLGIGLHSYGFMDAAFWWLAFFSCTQMALIALGAVPFGMWLSVKRGKLNPAGFKMPVAP